MPVGGARPKPASITIPPSSYKAIVEARAEMAAAIKKFVRVYMDVIEDPDSTHSEKLRAADSFLDRAGLARVSHVVDEQSGVRLTLREVLDELVRQDSLSVGSDSSQGAVQ